MSKVSRYDIGIVTDEWGMGSNSPGMLARSNGDYVRYEDYQELKAEIARQKECIRALTEQNAALIWGKEEDSYVSKAIADVDAFSAKLDEALGVESVPSHEQIAKLEAELKEAKELSVDTEYTITLPAGFKHVIRHQCDMIPLTDEQFEDYMSKPYCMGTWVRQKLARLAELEFAAEAVVKRWDTPLWKDVPHTAEYINALRNALE